MEHKKVATQWDGGWFCDKCYSLQHWKKEAWIENGRKYCNHCKEEIEKGNVKRINISNY